jgi:hypothetical protein
MREPAAGRRGSGRGLEVQQGEAIDRLLERLYGTPPGVIERVKAITE